MNATLFTFILAPLCVVWATSPDKLLRLTAVVSCFEAAAALTIGDYGIQPGLMPAFTFMGYMILQMALGARFSGLPAVWRVVLPFAVMTIYALITSYLMPRIFQDHAYVWPQKYDPPIILSVLAPTRGNINQDIYLVSNCAFLVLTAIYLARSNLSLAPFIRAYFLSGFLVVGVAVWQFANRMFGVPYPDALFYSNPDWAILTEQSIGAIPRINGPLTEPSALASYMASIVCATGWLLLQGRRGKTLWFLFIAGLLTIAISTSATGFVVLAIVGVGVPVYALVTRSTRMLASVVKVGVPLVIVGGLGFVVVGTFVPSIYGSVQDVATATFDKQQSLSYGERTDADLDSLAAMTDTYGLGVGWGSNRSSSLIPGLLAALGVPGFLMLLWFVFRVCATVRAARRIGCSSEQKLVIDACTGGLIGFLLSAVLSAPTITSNVFFLLLGLLIACATRVQLDARAAIDWRATGMLPAGSPVHAGMELNDRGVSGHGLVASNAIP